MKRTLQRPRASLPETRDFSILFDTHARSVRIHGARRLLSATARRDRGSPFRPLRVSRFAIGVPLSAALRKRHRRRFSALVVQNYIGSVLFLLLIRRQITAVALLKGGG
ncbi:hypothetical protein MRX96_020990 [Rhipicephalus microplus]